MDIDKSIPEQLLNGFVWAMIIIFSPVVLTYKLLRWFSIACIKETGNRLVRFFGAAFASILIVYLMQVIIQVK
jgi:hypothetical protein